MTQIEEAREGMIVDLLHQLVRGEGAKSKLGELEEAAMAREEMVLNLCQKLMSEQAKSEALEDTVTQLEEQNAELRTEVSKSDAREVMILDLLCKLSTATAQISDLQTQLAEK